MIELLKNSVISVFYAHNLLLCARATIIIVLSNYGNGRSYIELHVLIKQTKYTKLTLVMCYSTTVHLYMYSMLI